MFIVLLFVGCNEEKEKRLEYFKVQAEKSEIKQTKCFLDFQFGWTEEQYYSYIDTLIHEGKVHQRGISYLYDYNTKYGVYKLEIESYFYDNKLYEISFYSDDRFAYIGLNVDFINNKTDYIPIEINNTLYKDDKEYYYIKDNMIILFSRFLKNASGMTYINAPIAQKIKQEKENKADMTSKEFYNI